MMFDIVKKDLKWVREEGKLAAVALHTGKWLAGAAVWFLFLATAPKAVILTVLLLAMLAVFVMVGIGAVQDKESKKKAVAWVDAFDTYVAEHGYVPSEGDLDV